MALDDKSEIISHFIGLFDLKVEAARLRTEYEEFLALRNADPDLGNLLNVTVNVLSDYTLGDFIPDIKAPLFFPAIPGLEGLAALPFMPLLQALNWGPQPSALPNLPLYWSPPGEVVADPLFVIPPPSSIATITLQSNFLIDQDVIFGFQSDQPFFVPSFFDGALLTLASTASALQPIDVPDLPADEAGIADNGLFIAQSIRALQETGAAPSVDDATVFVAFDEDGTGPIVDGAQAEDMPDVADHSANFAKEVDEEGAAGGDPAVHEIVTGENFLVNQASIVTNWLDASVFVVMGDVVVANAVSQINAFNDINIVNGQKQPAEASTTYGVNASHIQRVDNPIVPAEGAASPSYVAVTQIDGNVLNFNHIQQYNFANDNDVVSVSFSASETFIQTGGNTLYNLANFLELGFFYDLIVVGGNMIDVSFLSQMNVLLDPDNIEVSGDFGGMLEMSGNLLFNFAAITEVGIDTPMAMTAAYGQTAESVLAGGMPDPAILDDPDFLGSTVLRVLNITGDFLDVQIINQINVLGDVDQVALAAQTYQSALGANVQVTTGGNELINIASITDIGVDSTIYTANGAYSDAMLYQAGFISADDPFAIPDMAALASEAVLFLADDMLTDAPETFTAHVVPPVPGELPIDVMQSILA